MKALLRVLTNVPLLTAIASILWVADGIFRRDIGTTMPIFSIIFYECLVGFILVLPLTIEQFLKEKPTLKELSVIGILSFLSIPLAIGLFMYAIVHPDSISFTTVYMIQKLQGIFSLLTFAVLTKRTLHKHFPLYAVIAFVGAFLMVANQSLVTWEWSTTTLTLGLTALAAAAAWGIGGIFSYAASQENSHQFVTSARFLGGMILAFIFLLIFNHATPLTQALTIPNGKDALLIILLGVASALVALIVYFRALKEIPSQLTTFLELLYPLLALVVDVAIFRTVPSVIQIVGIITIFIATIKINRLHDFTDLNEA